MFWLYAIASNILFYQRNCLLLYSSNLLFVFSQLLGCYYFRSRMFLTKFFIFLRLVGLITKYRTQNLSFAGITVSYFPIVYIFLKLILIHTLKFDIQHSLFACCHYPLVWFLYQLLVNFSNFGTLNDFTRSIMWNVAQRPRCVQH